MPLEADAEHVEAFALEPIGTGVDVDNARHPEWTALGQLYFEAQEAAVSEGAQMPHDLDGARAVAVLDRRYIDEIVVPLRRFVMQEAHEVM